MCGGNGRGWEGKGKERDFKPSGSYWIFAFLLKIFFITVLDLQKKNHRDSTESSHIPQTQLPPLKKSYISTIHLLQLENQHDE